MVLNQTKREIIKNRFRFLLFEVFVCFFLIFCASILEWLILPISLNPEIFGMLFYTIRLILVFLAIPTTIYLMDKYISPYKGKLRKTSKISVFKGHIMLYKIAKSNYKYQFLYGLILLFLVFIPLNFLLYLLVPEILPYHLNSMKLNVLNSYLFINDFALFFILLIVIQTSIVFAEESIYRGFINKRGSENFNKISAVFISSYSYGFLSLNFYRFNPWFPVIWFFTMFFIGLILSLLILRRKWLFPSIFSHSISNIIMVSIIWCFSKGWGYYEILLLIYAPLISISILVFILQYKRIKESISIGLNMLKKYAKNDDKEDEINSDKYFRIFIDFIIGFILFLISLLILV
ncbi:MAG: type II CAAX prenyl endopeptidase Rce1 family protein [Promethearchaeota archaeon]